MGGDDVVCGYEGDAELSVREGADLVPLSRRACAAALGVHEFRSLMLLRGGSRLLWGVAVGLGCL